MKNIGDYFYIIVMVVAIAASLIKKNKASQRTPSPMQSDEDEEEENNLPDMSQWLGNETPEPKQQTPVETLQPQVETIPQSFITHQYFTYDSHDSGKTTVKSTPSKPIEVEDLDAPTQTFDMRQAVIYSEILRRPEY